MVAAQAAASEGLCSLQKQMERSARLQEGHSDREAGGQVILRILWAVERLVSGLVIGGLTRLDRWLVR